MKSEFNRLKLIFFLNMAITFFLIFILWLYQGHTKQAEAYGWIFLGFAFWLILNILIKETDLPIELISTITVEDDDFKFPLQKAFGSLEILFLFSIALGILWGSYYSYGVIVNHQVFITVPNLMTISPFTSVFSDKALDFLETSWMVATVEESVWSGFMFPLMWGILFLILVLFKFPSNGLSTLLIAGLIAVLLNGYIVSYVFHSFVYGGNAFAYADANTHFTLSAFVTGATGMLVAPIIAHAMHNFAVKLAFSQGKFTVLPLQVVQENPDVNFGT